MKYPFLDVGFTYKSLQAQMDAAQVGVGRMCAEPADFAGIDVVEGAHEVDGSKALDATIDLFSGRTIEEVGAVKERKHLKEDLEAELEHLYHGEVLGVYFTDFVTQ